MNGSGHQGVKERTPKNERCQPRGLAKIRLCPEDVDIFACKELQLQFDLAGSDAYN